MNLEEKIQNAREALRNADAVLITAGAGMGVDSGLPDFRGKQGFWNAYPEAKKRGLSFSEMANPVWFESDPAMAWAFYGHRLHLYRDTMPHKGFGMLLECAKEKKGGYFVFTSNVDGQFQKAGFDNGCIEEVHGSIHHLQCIDDCRGALWSADKESVDIDMASFKAQSYPHCPDCRRTARPNILMFSDWGWNESRSYAQKRNFHRWLGEVDENNYRLVVVEIGAGEAVPTVRMMSENIAWKHRAPLIRINPRDFYLPESISGWGLPMGGIEGIENIL